MSIITVAPKRTRGAVLADALREATDEQHLADGEWVVRLTPPAEVG